MQIEIDKRLIYYNVYVVDTKANTLHIASILRHINNCKSKYLQHRLTFTQEIVHEHRYLKTLAENREDDEGSNNDSNKILFKVIN